MTYDAMTTEELKQIAIDIYHGKIFTDRHIRTEEKTPSLLGMIFMPILFWDAPPPDIDMLFEYLDKAGPRAINGYPMFDSCRYLNESDRAQVFRLYSEYEEHLKGWKPT